MREWRKSKGYTQDSVAEILKINLKSYSAYETGRTEVPHEVKKRLEKAGYDGPWPQEEAKATSTVDLSHLLTREEFAEWRGYWKAGTEKLLTDLVDQARRIGELEKQVADLQKQVLK